MTTLGNLADIASGKRPATVTKRPTADTNIPVVGGGGVSGYTDAALYSSGALVTGRVGTLGQLHVMHGPCWPSDNALVIVPKPGVDQVFLRYAVAAEISNAAEMNRGAANPLITQSDLKRLPVPDCSVDAQVAVGKLIRTLEERIELNKRMNETLELIAQAIFRDWCIDLGPVDRRQAGVVDPVELLAGVTSDRILAGQLLDALGVNHGG